MKTKTNSDEYNLVVNALDQKFILDNISSINSCIRIDTVIIVNNNTKYILAYKLNTNINQFLYLLIYNLHGIKHRTISLFCVACSFR